MNGHAAAIKCTRESSLSRRVLPRTATRINGVINGGRAPSLFRSHSFHQWGRRCRSELTETGVPSTSLLLKTAFGKMHPLSVSGGINPPVRDIGAALARYVYTFDASRGTFQFALKGSRLPNARNQYSRRACAYTAPLSDRQIYGGGERVHGDVPERAARSRFAVGIINYAAVELEIGSRRTGGGGGWGDGRRRQRGNDVLGGGDIRGGERRINF